MRAPLTWTSSPWSTRPPAAAAASLAADVRTDRVNQSQQTSAAPSHPQFKPDLRYTLVIP